MRTRSHVVKCYFSDLLITATAASVNGDSQLKDSAQVCAQKQVYSLFPNSHNALGGLTDTIRVRSGAGLTALRAL